MAGEVRSIVRCRDGKCMSDKPLQLSAAQVSQLSKLNDHFRNEFIHFKPQGWYIERALLPQIILTTVEIVEMLMAHPLVLYKIEDEQKAIRHRSGVLVVAS